MDSVLILAIIFGITTVFLIIKTLSFQNLIKKMESDKNSLESFNTRIDQAKKELEIIINRIEVLQIQKEKEELKLKNIPKNDSVEMTIKEFREITNKLVQQIKSFKEKEAIINFLKYDLTYIDTASTSYDIIEMQKELPLNQLVASISESGKIEWTVISKVKNSNLIIGKPKLRVEFYSEILKTIKRLTEKKKCS